MASNALSVINKVKYSGLDFDTHFDDIRARLQVKFAADFNDFALSSLGILLIDLSSFGLDTLSFYLDRRATEAYLDTARTRSAVARLTRQLGYKMGSATSSSADLIVAIAVPQAFSVPIPKGFQFKGPNDLIFETAEQVTFTAGSGPNDVQTVPTYEGETVVETFTSNGTVNQVYDLRRVPNDKAIALGTVKVNVDGGGWNESMFLSYDSTDQFECGYNDDPPTVSFGDGITGNIPPNGATIRVQYVACRGKTGQVSSNTIQDVVNPLVANFTNIALTVNNPDRSVGGDDAESIEKAKANAGKVFKSRQVAVTREDYEALASSYADPLFGRVAVAQAISSRSADADLELQSRVSAIRTALDGAEAPITALVADAATRFTTIDTALASLATQLQDIADVQTTIDATSTTAVTSARASKNRAQEIIADCNEIISQVTDGLATIAASDPTDDAEATAAFAALTAILNLIQTAITTSVTTSAAAIQSSADTEIAALGTIQDDVETVGTDLETAGTKLLLAEAARAEILAEIGEDDDTTGLRLAVATVDASTATFIGLINEDLDGIVDHVDKLLSADCTANLVSVPILSRDASGFYAAPSISLIQSLQTHLDARKEVTQTVKVTSGAPFLVPAQLAVRVGLLPGFSAAVQQKAVEAVVDAVLRDRKFGHSLAVSDVDQPIKTVRGVDFVNVQILGHTTTFGLDSGKLDGSGNLVIARTEVVTKGVVTVSMELSTRAVSS